MDRGYWVYADPKRTPVDTLKRPLSHVFFDGGRASVPPGVPRGQFEQVYADAVACGAPQHCNELTPPGHPFRFFADLDTKSITSVQEDTPIALRVAETMHKIDARFQKVVICTKSEGRGVHMVWENECAVVTQRRALELRESCVRTLTSSFPSEDWAKMFDEGVFKKRQANLRTVWSRSKTSTGYYRPSAVWEATDATDATDATGGGGRMESVVSPELDLVNWVRRCSICAPGDSPVHHLSQSDIEPPSSLCEDPMFQTFSTSSAEIEDPDGRLSKLHGILPDEYKTARFTSVRELDCAIMLGLDSRHCFNIGRPHKSNRVYLQIDSYGVGQRCHCSCDTTEGRAFGRCSETNVPLLGPQEHPFSEIIVAKLEKKRRKREEEERPLPLASSSTTTMSRLNEVPVSSAIDRMRKMLHDKSNGVVVENKTKRKKNDTPHHGAKATNKKKKNTH